VVAWAVHSGVKELGRSHSDEGKNDNNLIEQKEQLKHLQINLHFYSKIK
jgi:hypothetical protein